MLGEMMNCSLYDKFPYAAVYNLMTVLMNFDDG